MALNPGALIAGFGCGMMAGNSSDQVWSGHNIFTDGEFAES